MKPTFWKTITGAGIVLGISALTCIEEYRLKNPTPNSTRGHVVRERLWHQPSFGMLYRVEVRTAEKNEPYRAYVVVGNEKELRALDEKINVGDQITVTDHYSAYTLDLEKVITPHDITKMN